MRSRSAVVLCGPVTPLPAIASLIPSDALVVAADGAIDHAEALGLEVGWLVGDLDSITPDALYRAVAGGVEVISYPADKDETDLELALSCARDLGATDALVLDGGIGPRLDHFLANASVVASTRWQPMRLRAVLGDALVTVVHADGTAIGLEARFGSVVSLLAFAGEAFGVRTSGLRWNLEGESLLPNVGRGVSNVILDTRATVSVGAGVVIAVQPGAIR
jgi:thiamine pyrophosphokinase